MWMDVERGVGWGEGEEMERGGSLRVSWSEGGKEGGALCACLLCVYGVHAAAA